MAFRDDREALRERVRSLEGDLERTQGELEALRSSPDPSQELGAATARSPHERAAVLGPRARWGWRVVGVLVISALISALIWRELGSRAVERLDRQGAPLLAAVPIDGGPGSLGRRVLVVEWLRGVVPAHQLSEGCIGYLPPQPFVEVQSSVSLQLRASVTSVRPILLALEREDGTVSCSSGETRLSNASLGLTLEAGRHRLWVGTVGQGEEVSPEVVLLTEVLHSPVATETWGSEPQTPDSSGGYLPLRGETASLRPVSELARGEGCEGWTTVAPFTRLRVREPQRMRFERASPRPGRIVWVPEEGSASCWASSTFSIELPPGVHQLWVATRDEGELRSVAVSVQPD